MANASASVAPVYRPARGGRHVGVGHAQVRRAGGRYTRTQEMEFSCLVALTGLMTPTGGTVPATRFPGGVGR